MQVACCLISPGIIYCNIGTTSIRDVILVQSGLLLTASRDNDTFHFPFCPVCVGFRRVFQRLRVEDNVGGVHAEGVPGNVEAGHVGHAAVLHTRVRHAGRGLRNLRNLGGGAAAEEEPQQHEHEAEAEQRGPEHAQLQRPVT